MFHAEGVVDKVGSIFGCVGHFSQLGGDAFHRFKDCMEVVFPKQLGIAEAEHVLMDVSLFKLVT